MSSFISFVLVPQSVQMIAREGWYINESSKKWPESPHQAIQAAPQAAALNPRNPIYILTAQLRPKLFNPKSAILNFTREAFQVSKRSEVLAAALNELERPRSG